jgi:hypothetical protein
VSAKNENFKKVYEDYSEFRKDQNLWFRFTEARFDSFMQAHRSCNPAFCPAQKPRSAGFFVF